MSDTYPENIIPENGPSSLDTRDINNEIANDRYAVVFNAGFLALCATLTSTEVVPRFIQAVEHSNIGNIAQYGILGVSIGGLSTMAVQSIRSYRNRWVQARYNQRLNKIVEENGLES